jgi:hypothetical protein
MLARRSALAGLLLFSALAACSSDEHPSPPATKPSGPDPAEFAAAPRSCVFKCPIPSDCAEASGPYACPSLGPWAEIPHADTCPTWDGKTPTPQAGKCKATEPTGDAIKYVGPDPDDPQTLILPDGHRLRPAGAAWVFKEPDLYAGMTSNVVAIPDSSLVLTVDTGYGDHVVRLVDAAKIGQGDPVLGLEKFPNPSTLNWGMAVAGPDRAYVATDDGVVQAFKIDVAAKTLARDDARSITLPPSKDNDGKPASWYVSGVAASADGKRLAVSPVAEKALLVYDVDPQSAGYGKLLGKVDLGGNETFGVFFDPHDAASSRAYVSMWSGRAVVEVDVSDPASPKVARSFATDKDPQGVTFLDARWMVVANDLGDTLSLVDRVTGMVHAIPIDTKAGPHGAEPSTLAYDAATKHLYVALAALGAVGVYDVDLAKDPPSILPAGRLPTQWWPSGVALLGDGSVVISSLRGEGTGPANEPDFSLQNGDAYKRLHGGVQRIPSPSAAELSAGEAFVKNSVEVASRPGYPKVECPDGANDFPVPPTNDAPSQAIQHVFIIVRENKTFDGVLGDYPGANGDPSMTLKKKPEDMAAIWKNLRALGGRFSMSDNFYTSAEISSLGHVWTTYGRSNDYNERTWAMAAYGRNARPSDVQNGGVVDVGRPEEGSLFEWLGQNGVAYDILGEAVGIPKDPPTTHPPIDFHYPGGFIQSPSYPDVEKACHIAARARVTCDLGSVVYLTLPNDHTQGLSPSSPTPEVTCAVNDEATGMVIDAISKSPLWPTSLILITEDDTAQGGDHVDQHRTILVAASPWVKRGYVSKTRIDVPAIHKLIAHVLGLPYPNAQVANAGLPLDMFTSTPDYAPYDYAPRAIPMACGTGASPFEQQLTERWKLDDVDRSPGLDAQVTRWMRGEQWTEAPARATAKAAR